MIYTFMNIDNKLRLFIMLLAVVLLNIAGCAYYNVYYNAQKAYNDAVEQVENSSATEISPQAKQRFDIAIAKASKVLELHPGSRWADDALIMIGKSYYYQGNFPDAIEKFEELFNIFPDSKFVPEARSLYSKTLISEGKYDLAEFELNEIIDADTKEKFKSEAYLSLAELRYFRDDYDGAIELYRRILTDIKDKKIRAGAQLRIAESYFETEQYEIAAEEYAKVNDYDPSLVQRFTSEFGFGLCSERLEDYSSAIAIFIAMLSDDDFESNYSELLLEIARCWELLEDYDQALFVLETLNQYDIETPPSFDKIVISQSAAQSNNQLSDSLIAPQQRSATFIQVPDKNPEALYNIGEIYLKKISDLNKAKLYYTRAYAVGSIQEIGPQINSRIKYISEIQRMSANQYKKPPIEPVYIPPPDTTMGPDSTLIISPTVSPAPGAQVYADSIEFVMAIDGYSNDVLDYQQEIAGSMFRIAEIFLTEFEMPDSAVKYFEDIVEFFGDTPDAPKALSMQIEIANNYGINDPEQLKSELLSTYEGSVFANMFSDNADAVESFSNVANTNVDSAQVLFEAAESAFFQEEYTEAVDIYSTITIRYKDNDLVPKALFAAAWIYENHLNDPGKAVLAYEKLNNQYKNSDVSKALSFKLNELYKLREAEKREERLVKLRQQLEEEKIIAMEKAYQDSINIEILIEQFDRKDESFILSLESDTVVVTAAEVISYGEVIIADSIAGQEFEGYIDIRILINAVGQPMDREVFRSTINIPSIIKSVLTASGNSKFSPAIDPLNRPVDAWHLLRFIFPQKQ